MRVGMFSSWFWVYRKLHLILCCSSYLIWLQYWTIPPSYLESDQNLQQRLASSQSLSLIILRYGTSDSLRFQACCWLEGSQSTVLDSVQKGTCCPHAQPGTWTRVTGAVSSILSKASLAWSESAARGVTRAWAWRLRPQPARRLAVSWASGRLLGG